MHLFTLVIMLTASLGRAMVVGLGDSCGATEPLSYPPRDLNCAVEGKYKKERKEVFVVEKQLIQTEALPPSSCDDVRFVKTSTLPRFAASHVQKHLLVRGHQPTLPKQDTKML